MKYTKVDWLDRLSTRGDLCPYVTHMTRPQKRGAKVISSVDVLAAILSERRIRASTTASGFVVGTVGAVCFYDMPLENLREHINYEHEKTETYTPGSNRLSFGVGLVFPKRYAYSKGARPVVYERTEDAKQWLRQSQWWRIVDFDLENPHAMTDWTHEREWRSPGDFRFELDQTAVVLGCEGHYQCFLEHARLADIRPQLADALLLKDLRWYSEKQSPRMK